MSKKPGVQKTGEDHVERMREQEQKQSHAVTGAGETSVTPSRGGRTDRSGDRAGSRARHEFQR